MGGNSNTDAFSLERRTLNSPEHRDSGSARSLGRGGP